MAVDRIGDGLALRSKGDIVSYDGTNPISISAGTNGQILYAQSSATAGVQWQTAPVAETQSYELISTSVINTNTKTVSFTSIPTSYTHLYIRGVMQDTGNTGLAIRVNESSTIQYRWNRVRRSDSSVQSTISTTDTEILIGSIAYNATSSGYLYNPVHMTIHSYANTSYYKDFTAYSGYLGVTFAGGQASTNVGSILTTSAISSVQLICNLGGSANFTSGTYFSLYGLKG